MLKTVERLYDNMVPEPAKLWERAGASGELILPDRFVQRRVGNNQLQDTTIRHTGEISVPDFNLSIASREEAGFRELRGENSEVLGEVYDWVYVLSDNVDRRARLILPVQCRDDRIASPVGTSGTAFTTTIDGYAGMRSEELALAANIPVIQVGCEYSGPGNGACDLIDIAKGAPRIAMAKSVQGELVIIRDIIDRFGLNTEITPHGDSRGSISALGQAAMADAKDFVGLSVPYVDPKAIVLHNRVPFEELPRAFRWLSKELTLGGAVLAKVVAESGSRNIASTISANPRFWVGTLGGIMPALLAGESGEFTKRLPPDIYGCVVAYGHDELYDADNWHEGLAPFDNLYRKDVPKGLHMHLMTKSSTSMQIGRLAGAADAIRNGGLNRDELCALAHCTDDELGIQHQVDLVREVA